MTLQDRTALVTGAGSGIGLACALDLANAGAIVIVADIDHESAGAAADRICQAHGAGRATAAALDVRSPEQAEAVVAAIVQAHGRLDVAVNNAGVGTARVKVVDLTLDQWHDTHDVNLHGVFHCLQAEIRAMRVSGGGSIVNIGSILSVVGFENAGAYISSKHAVLGLTRAAALDHAVDAIRVNAVGPGFVATQQFVGATSQEEKDSVTGLHPRGQIAAPEDVAALVTFLASPAARNITGAYYANDGGFTAQ